MIRELSNASDVIVVLSCAVVLNILRSCFVNLGVGIVVFFVSLRVHFNVILVSVGVFWRPCALQGSPERGRVENVSKKVVRGSTTGPPKSTQNLSKSIEI